MELRSEKNGQRASRDTRVVPDPGAWGELRPAARGRIVVACCGQLRVGAPFQQPAVAETRRQGTDCRSLS